jgi:ribosomal protein L40E
MKDMRNNWILVGRYIAVIIASLLVGVILGNMDLFEKTSIGDTRLTASQIVRFLGYGGALVVFWLAVQRVTFILNQQGGRWSSLQHVLLPLGTLIVISAAYSVLLLVLDPLMDRDMKGIYNWVFILATIASAVWLIVAMFNQSSSLTEMVMGNLLDEQQSDEQKCGACGAKNPKGAKFCARCGQAL